jgi:hypothetical protein
VFENFSRCGNLGNIMFDPEGEPVAIDNTMNAFDRTTVSVLALLGGFPWILLLPMGFRHSCRCTHLQSFEYLHSG